MREGWESDVSDPHNYPVSCLRLVRPPCRLYCDSSYWLSPSPNYVAPPLGWSEPRESDTIITLKQLWPSTVTKKYFFVHFRMTPCSMICIRLCFLLMLILWLVCWYVVWEKRFFLKAAGSYLYFDVKVQYLYAIHVKKPSLSFLLSCKTPVEKNEDIYQMCKYEDVAKSTPPWKSLTLLPGQHHSESEVNYLDTNRTQNVTANSSMFKQPNHRWLCCNHVKLYLTRFDF